MPSTTSLHSVGSQSIHSISSMGSAASASSATSTSSLEPSLEVMQLDPEQVEHATQLLRVLSLASLRNLDLVHAPCVKYIDRRIP